MTDGELLLVRARHWVDEAQRVVALTGAGISTDSGIPDFRGPQGVWTKDPAAERSSHISAYLADPDVRRRTWHSRLHSPAWHARPNAGHLALVHLERRGKLDVLVTQNIDGLHQLAGSHPGRVLEVHGTLRRYACLSCGAGGPMEVVLDRLRAGDADPTCAEAGCGGILKSATVSFGQPLPADVLDRAFDAVQRCDVLLAVGTSLTVQPIASAVPLALQAGARVVVVNASPTPYDEVVDVVVPGPISDVLPVIVGSTSPAPAPDGESRPDT
ncbi:MAG TPA: Sir2 family NAD-dependent protein deacetylase [Acidimicrobiales bacterium]|nr:Sir2 family NAD-dependent protein deacetylase [Acidimicrobiales bacterium]